MNRRPGTHAPHFTDHPVVQNVRRDVNPYMEAHRRHTEVIPADIGPSFRGRWSDAFSNPAPLLVELGAGNGDHLAGIAARHPEYNCLGIELRFKRVDLCARKIQQAGVKNAKILRYNWFYLSELFEDASIDTLHMHHPDPWVKHKQSRNRVIDAAFVAEIGRLLKSGADWRMKTDFEPHISSLISYLPGQPFEILAQRSDMAKEGAPWDDDICTNYQRKSQEKGSAIHAIWLRRT